MWADVRLTIRLHRFEVLAVVLGSLLVATAAIAVAWHLNSLHVPVECFGNADVHGPTGSTTAACRNLYGAFAEANDREAERVFAVLAGFPVLAGMLLGVPLVSRELEHGTAVLPWVLGGRRRRWLTRRTLIIGAILAAALVTVAIAADLLEGIRDPLVPAGRSFAAEGLRGPVLVARGIAGFGIGIFLGAVIGRQLPALIMGLVASLVIVVGGLVIMDAWSQAVATYVPAADAHLGDRSIRAAYRSKGDGHIVSPRDIVDLIPPRPDLLPGAIDDQWIAEHFDEVLLVVPGSRYMEETWIHTAVLVAVGSVGFVASAQVVDRRRPG